ncbi:hypothetical protein, partial [Bradyrhizobium zhanjiangense]|uniref:hypothetical protein n=1 Tax=Bradyrhizobium zhanjiangense TaxID=1325107 RepID=UPI0019D6C115
DCSGNSPKSPSSAIILSSKSICLENHIRLTLDTEKSHSLVGWDLGESGWWGRRFAPLPTLREW